MIFLGRLKIACLENVALIALEADSYQQAVGRFCLQLAAVYEALASFLGVPFPRRPESIEELTRARDQLETALACPACGERFIGFRVEEQTYRSMAEVQANLGRFSPLSHEHNGPPGLPTLLASQMAALACPADGKQFFRRPPPGKAREN